MRITRKSGLRMTALAGLSAALIGALAAPGHAGDGESVVRIQDGRISYTGTAGTNDVRILQSGGELHVLDTVNIDIVGEPACRYPRDHDGDVVRTRVACDGVFTAVSAELREGDDSFESLVPLDGLVVGEEGSDVFYGGRATGVSSIHYSGGANSPGEPADVDTMSYEHSTGPVTVTLTGSSDDGREGDTDGIGDMDKVIGSSFDDSLIGNAAANILVGGGGSDKLSGRNGTDTLEAADGVVDKAIDCGSGEGDVAHRDADDPVAIGCEAG
ncbi:hypothetical protein [Streptosporangium sp. OZ121]|uniref:hypothetical protein n=1 Tax=Streptosporangium sp. OZ121 TaxID=3444183 RepID=UPI003F792626